MVTKAEITVYSSGIQDTVQSNMTLNSIDTSHTFNFDSDSFMLSICLKDVVDLKDFDDMLNGKQKKNVLHCTLNNGEKEYKGLRKVLFSNSQLSVSLGGMRFEFNKNINSDFKKIIKELKSKMGI